MLYSVAGLIFCAAASPGPNTLIAARLGASRRWDEVFGGAVAIVLGGLILLSAAWFGLPRAAGLLLPFEVVGAVYLIWLGARSISLGGEPAASGGHRTFVGLLAFQLVNPKAWVLVFTAVAATRAHGGHLLHLSIVFIVVSASSLFAWAAGGAFAARRLTLRLQQRVRTALALALIASGFGVIINAFH